MKKKLLVLSLLAFVFAAASYSQTGYYCDFEDAAENANWQLNVGPKGKECVNKWYVGSAISNGGHSSMYISCDSGRTASYTQSATTVSAYRLLTLPAGQYELSFDWQAFGYNSLDALYCCWMPDSVKSNSQTGNSNVPLYVETYARQFGDSIKMYGNTWNTVSDTITSDGVTPYKLVFVWNNKSVGSFPPGACVDNICIIPVGVCEKPSDIEVELEEQGVRVSWDGDAYAYDIRCKSSTDTRWQEFTGYTSNELFVSGIGEGVFEFYIRSDCGMFKSVWVSHSQFIFFPGTRCVDYLDLNNSNCYYGTFANPMQSRGAVDRGYPSVNSRHTIHYMKSETDPRTGGKLRTVPEDELASVRLGNWGSGAQAEAVEYDYHVDTAENAVLLVKYAVVLQNPNHGIEEQPRFTLSVLNDGERLDSLGCAEADFSAGFVSAADGWHDGIGTEAPQWKEWTTVGINLKDYQDQDLTIRLTTYDCSPSAHYGYAYFVLGCSDGKIQGLSCGEDAKNRFKAPDGFNYRWYLPDNPDSVICEDQIFETTQSDTLTYACDVIQPTKGGCYYTVTARAVPRYPVVKGGYTARVQDCENIVSFADSSYVKHVNPYTGVVDTADAECDSIVWHFLDEGISVRGEEFEQMFPRKGGTYRVMLSAHLSQCYEDTVFEITLPDLDSDRDTVHVVHCGTDPYYWDVTGQYYFSSDCYSDTADTGNEYGCEDIMTLDLLMVPIDTVPVVDTVCTDKLPYVFNGEELYETGNYTFVLENRYKCDSVVTLDLLVNESLTFEGMGDALLAGACADDGQIEIPYTVSSGLVTKYDVTFADEEADRRMGMDGVQPDGPQVVIPLGDSVLPGRYEAEILFHNAECGDVGVPLTVEVYYPDSVIVQRWNDVLGIRNGMYNGGYEFTAYQWYKDGAAIEGETGPNLYAPDGLDTAAVYSAMLTRTGDGVQMMTCGVQPRYYSAIEITPTVVMGGGTVSVKSQSAGVIRLWNMTGQLAGSYEMTPGYTQIAAPGAAGTYVVEIVLTDGSRKTEKIIVRGNM